MPKQLNLFGWPDPDEVMVLKLGEFTFLAFLFM